MTHVHIIVVLITFLVNEFKIFKNWIWYLTKKKALQFFLIFFQMIKANKQCSMKLPCDNVKILMNGVQSKPLMWGHVTRPRPIRGRGNSDESASRAPRAETGRSQWPGRSCDAGAGPRPRASPASLQSRQQRNPSSGKHQHCATDLGAKFHYFEIL